MRVALIADDFRPPDDEGFKKLVHRLALEIAQFHTLLAIGQNSAEAPYPLEAIPTNRFLISLKLKRRIREFSPNLILYVPFSSFTRNSFLRCRILAGYAVGAPIAMIGVQSRSWRQWEFVLMRWTAPDLVLTPIESAVSELNAHRIRASFIPFGVDLEKFSPVVDEDEKKRLRADYGLSTQDRIILHVGQITKQRNVGLLSRLQGQGRQVLVVGSSSSTDLGFPHDPEVAGDLEKAGVKVWIRYLPNIEDIYRLSDLYVFPVFHQTGGIGFPLSVVESLACGVPAVTTRYGGLPRKLPECRAVRYAESDDELVSLAEEENTISTAEARHLVTGLSWGQIAHQVVERACCPEAS